MSRKCKVCKTAFEPTQPFQTWCCPDHGFLIAAGKLDKIKKAAQVKERRADQVTREKLKSKAQWAREAQDAVNKYVRLRDAHLGCVSCDKPASWDGQWHASHFRSIGAASAVRFNLWNIHKSCSICNNWKSGNLSEYEPRLREKIGAEKVDWLRTQNQLSAHSIDYLKRLKIIFKKRAKRLEMVHSC